MSPESSIHTAVVLSIHHCQPLFPQNIENKAILPQKISYKMEMKILLSGLQSQHKILEPNDQNHLIHQTCSLLHRSPGHLILKVTGMLRWKFKTRGLSIRDLQKRGSFREDQKRGCQRVRIWHISSNFPNKIQILTTILKKMKILTKGSQKSWRKLVENIQVGGSLGNSKTAN